MTSCQSKDENSSEALGRAIWVWKIEGIHKNPVIPEHSGSSLVVLSHEQPTTAQSMGRWDRAPAIQRPQLRDAKKPRSALSTYPCIFSLALRKMMRFIINDLSNFCMFCGQGSARRMLLLGFCCPSTELKCLFVARYGIARLSQRNTPLALPTPLAF